jgi:hypothetical protein
MKKIAIVLLLLFVIVTGLTGVVFTKMTRVNLVNSLVDNTVIGSVTPAVGTFTTANATTFVGALTGNVTGNVTGTLTGSVVGNASTSTQLQSAPSQCGTVGATVLTGVSSTGAPIACGPNIRTAFLTTGCTTASPSFSTCTDNVNWNSSFPNGNQVYSVCSGSGSDARAAISSATADANQVHPVTVTNGSVAVHENNITCIGVQF